MKKHGWSTIPEADGSIKNTAIRLALMVLCCVIAALFMQLFMPLAPIDFRSGIPMVVASVLAGTVVLTRWRDGVKVFVYFVVVGLGGFLILLLSGS